MTSIGVLLYVAGLFPKCCIYRNPQNSLVGLAVTTKLMWNTPRYSDQSNNPIISTQRKGLQQSCMEKGTLVGLPRPGLACHRSKGLKQNLSYLSKAQAHHSHTVRLGFAFLLCDWFPWQCLSNNLSPEFSLQTTSVSTHVCSTTFNSLQLHGWQPTRLLCPWDFPGKKTGVGCHFLPQGHSVWGNILYSFHGARHVDFKQSS